VDGVAVAVDTLTDRRTDTDGAIHTVAFTMMVLLMTVFMDTISPVLTDSVMTADTSSPIQDTPSRIIADSVEAGIEFHAQSCDVKPHA
jgi:hypothetical protein